MTSALKYHFIPSESMKITSIHVIPDTINIVSFPSLINTFSDSFLGTIQFFPIGLKRVHSTVVFKKGLSGFEDSLRNLQRDSNIVNRCHYLNGILGCTVDKKITTTIYMIYLLPSHGSLGQALGISPCFVSKTNTNLHNLHPSIKFSIVIDILNGLFYLHQNNMIHGFLHLDNILVYDNYRIKLAEFGFINHLKFEHRNKIWKSDCLRYLSPEIASYLIKYDQEINTLYATNPSNTTGKQHVTVRVGIDKMSDMYSLGCVIVSLLSTKYPFANLSIPEDVIASIAGGDLPHLPSQYSDKDALQPLEQFLFECLSNKAENRPMANMTSISRLENSYYDVEVIKKNQEIEKRKSKIMEIENEIKDYETNISKLEDLTTNGKLLIKQRESKLIMIFNAKEKREAEQAIEKAIKKLKDFEEELEGFRIDRIHALEDLKELNARQERVHNLIVSGKVAILKARDTWVDTMDQEKLLKTYCPERDMSYMKGLLFQQQSNNITEGSFTDSILKMGTYVNNLGSVFGSDLYLDKSLDDINDIDLLNSTSSSLLSPSSSRIPSSSRPISVVLSSSSMKTASLANSLSTSSVKTEQLMKDTTIKPIDSDDEIEEDVDIIHRNIDRTKRASKRKSYEITSTSVKNITRVIDSDDEFEQEEQLQPQSQSIPSIPINDKKESIKPLSIVKQAASKSRKAVQEIDSDDEFEEDEAEMEKIETNQEQSELSEISSQYQSFDVDSDDDVGAYEDDNLEDKSEEYKNSYGGSSIPSTLVKSTVLPQSKNTVVDPNILQQKNIKANLILGKDSKTAATTTNTTNTNNIRVSDLLSTTWKPSLSPSSSPSFQGGLYQSQAQAYLDRGSRFTFSGTSDPNRGESSFVRESALRSTENVLNYDLSPWEQLEIEYLAAARGIWDEAIGMRRAGLNLDEEYIHALIDRLETPVHLAATAGHFQVIQRLVEGIGLDPWSFNSKGRQPLHFAAKKGHVRIVRYLLETVPPTIKGNASPAETADRIGLSPLIYSVIGGHINVLKYLIEFSPIKSSPSAVDVEYGASLLHWACISNQLQIVEYLVDNHYVDIEARAKMDGSTSMLWASYGGSIEILDFLNHRGAKLYPKYLPRGFTCLHMATASGSVFKTKYLLDNGCKMTDVSEEGLNPYDVATGKCEAYLKVRKQEGFITGSVLDKVNPSKR